MRDRYLPIGTPVAFTHRACGVVWCPTVTEPSGILSDSAVVVEEEHWNWSRRDRRFAPRFTFQERSKMPRPSRRDSPTSVAHSKIKALDRWVYAWPEDGNGYIVGLTFRSEGFRDRGPVFAGYGEPPEYEQAYLDERERFPLYEIRRTLRSASVLCPIWAVMES